MSNIKAARLGKLRKAELREKRTRNLLNQDSVKARTNRAMRYFGRVGYLSGLTKKEREVVSDGIYNRYVNKSDEFDPFEGKSIYYKDKEINASLWIGLNFENITDFLVTHKNYYMIIRYLVGRKIMSYTVTVNNLEDVKEKFEHYIHILSNVEEEYEEYDDDLFSVSARIISVDVIKYKEKETKARRGEDGKWFPWHCKIQSYKEDWGRYGVYTREHPPEKYPCLFQCFKEWGQLTAEELEKLFHQILTTSTTGVFKKLSLQFNIKIVRFYSQKGRVSKSKNRSSFKTITYKPVNADNCRSISIGVGWNHFFLHEKLPYSMAIGGKRLFTSSDLLFTLHKYKEEFLLNIDSTYEHFHMEKNISKKDKTVCNDPRIPNCGDKLQTELWEEEESIKKQLLYQKSCESTTDRKSFVNGKTTVIMCYLDTETCVNEDKSFKCYQACCKLSTGEMISKNVKTSDNVMTDVFEELAVLTYHIPKLSFKMYVHQLAFDYLVALYATNISSNYRIMEAGNKICSVNIQIRSSFGKQFLIELIDTYSMSTFSLNVSCKNFGILQQKEMFPHTDTQRHDFREKINKNNIINMLPENKDIFIEKCQEMNLIDSSGNIDILKYSEYYCKQDVNLLEQLTNKLRDYVMEQYGLDLDKITTRTLGGLHMKWLKYKRKILEGCHLLSGNVHAFCHQAVIGGRTQTRKNKPVVINPKDNIKLVPLDVNSLYPAAMSQFDGIPLGEPKYSTNPKVLINSDYFVVDATLKKLNKKGIDLPFAILCENMGDKLIWDDDKLVGKTIRIEKYTFEDAIKYLGAKWEVHQGIYFDQGFNTTICEEMQKTFDKRYKMKNPNIEKGEVYNSFEKMVKLSMNSVYGKCIQKRVTEETAVFVGTEEEFISKVLKRPASYGSWSVHPSGKIIYKKINLNGEHSGIPHVACAILGYSKRIMNRAIYMLYKCGVEMYYTDTDSIYLETGPKLEFAKKEFKRIFGVNMTGDKLGQFSNDFKVKSDPNTEIYSDQAVFLTKKVHWELITHIIKDKNVYTDNIKMRSISNCCYDTCSAVSSRPERFIGPATKIGNFQKPIDFMGNLVRYQEDENFWLEFNLAKEVVSCSNGKKIERSKFRIEKQKNLEQMLKTDLIRRVRANGIQEKYNPVKKILLGIK